MEKSQCAPQMAFVNLRENIVCIGTIIAFLCAGGWIVNVFTWLYDRMLHFLMHMELFLLPDVNY